MGLKIENVSKSFGRKLVVDNISIELDKPGVFGLLGTNGAGKSTTIRMLLGILKKDKGTITWNGQEVDRKKVNFGYLPEERGVYPKVKIIDQLKYFAELKGMEKEEAIKSINKWAKELKVEEYLEMPAEKLSKGNQQKIQFMTCVIHNPELVVLDEPFSGLDPVNTEILKNIIINLVKKGKYIITVFEGLTDPVEGILIIFPPIIVELFNQDIYDSYPQIEEKEITQIKDYVYILFSHEEKWDYI